MTWWHVIGILLAGFAAGGINAVVGSGSLITFPTLLAFGLPPVTANISNNIGLVPGGVSGTWGYRQHLRGQGARIARLAPMSLAGGVAGAVLLLVLPAAAFQAVVPVLLGISLVLVVAQPRLQRAMAARRQRVAVGGDQPVAGDADAPEVTGPEVTGGDGAGGRGHLRTAMGAAGVAGVYGGYFGAAQGVLLVGVLGALLPEPLQRVNALKNLLVLGVNAMAAVVFAAVAWGRIDWTAAGLIAVGSMLGGLAGARVGRRLSPVLLRTVIVVVGLAAIVQLLLK
jgi:hypothetical protein